MIVAWNAQDLQQMIASAVNLNIQNLEIFVCYNVLQDIFQINLKIV